MARFKYRKHIRFVDELPLTATMKVEKSELKEKFAGEREARATQSRSDTAWLG